MAIYHNSVKVIGRSSGRSVVAAAAYRAGERLVDYETGVTSDYTCKGGVVHSEINLCTNAPEAYKDRQTLWNAVTKIENRKNSQLAREIEVALPREFDRELQISVIREYVDHNFIQSGMCADWSIHDKNDGNVHCHILLTTRPIAADGSWKAKERKAYKLDASGERIPVIDPITGMQKISGGRRMWERETLQENAWNSKEMLCEWRASWAEICNSNLEKLGVDDRIDHRSYREQGLDLEATRHEGVAAREIQRRGGVSEICQANREILERRGFLLEIREKIRDVAEEIKETILEKIGKVGDLIGGIERDHNESTEIGERSDRSEQVDFQSASRTAGSRSDEVSAFIRSIDIEIENNRTCRNEQAVERSVRDFETERPEMERRRDGVAEEPADFDRDPIDREECFESGREC